MHRIMVVDDEVVITTQLEERLTSMGYMVVGSASSGEEAVDMARCLRPDLILMDIVMPGKLDGINAAETIKAEQDIPIIFLTAYAHNKFVSRAKKVEPFGYIVKPFQDTELRAMIEVALYKKELERKLQASEEQFRAIVENSVDEIMMIDKEGRYLAINTCAASSAGLKPEDMVNKTLWELFPKEQADNLFEPCKQVFASKKAASRITHHRNVLGRGFKWVHSIIAPVLSENKDVEAVVIISRDITRQKEMEQKLKETASQLTSIMDSATEYIIAAYALNKKWISENHFEE